MGSPGFTSDEWGNLSFAGKDEDNTSNLHEWKSIRHTSVARDRQVLNEVDGKIFAVLSNDDEQSNLRHILIIDGTVYYLAINGSTYLHAIRVSTMTPTAAAAPAPTDHAAAAPAADVAARLQPAAQQRTAAAAARKRPMSCLFG